ncbi:MAG: DUF4426 domain-containing protein [Silanimonas sp.]
MHRRPNSACRTAIALALMLVTSVAFATAPAPAKPSLTLSSGKNSTQSGEFTVHYNAMPSTQLTPEIATRYGITRSANRALLNVSVMKGPRATEAVAVPARIDAAATNPNGQRQALRLREVRDRGAIYYLGEARIDERDTLDFELTVTPEGGTPINARYRQEFWPPTPAR